MRPGPLRTHQRPANLRQTRHVYVIGSVTAIDFLEADDVPFLSCYIPLFSSTLFGAMVLYLCRGELELNVMDLVSMI